MVGSDTLPKYQYIMKVEVHYWANPNLSNKTGFSEGEKIELTVEIIKQLTDLKLYVMVLPCGWLYIDDKMFKQR